VYLVKRVSVVVPLYNKAPYIGRALDSIAAQTFTDFEAIVVDDGSTDRGPDIAASYGDPRFRVVKQPNMGPGSARNRGIEEAGGELIAFLDADDAWLPRYLEHSLAVLEGAGAAVATITTGYIEQPAGISREGLWKARGIAAGVHRVDAGTSPERLVFMLAYMSPCTTIARASILRRWNGFFSARRCLYGEDAFLWLKVLLNHPVAFELQPLVHIHTDASSLGVGRTGVRPIEPFLESPEQIETCCPSSLRPLLAGFLATRAFKTACVLGYGGQWRTARALVRRHYAGGAWRLPYFAPALVCSSPLGGWLGHLLRAVTTK
jgi:Glycosyl transferase family 2